MISPAERAACTLATQSAMEHLEARDVGALRRDLEALGPLFVYSDYPFYRDWNSAKPRITRLLFESLPFEEFLVSYAGRNFSRFEIWIDLDPIAPEIPSAQCQILCEKFRFPHPNTSPRAVQRLADAPESGVTPWLCEWIEACFEREREGITRDIYVFSSPLADALRILALRRDAVEICAAMLRERRFDSGLGMPNRALLDGLSAQNSEGSRRVLLELAQKPGEAGVRLALLAKVADFAPRQALDGALFDLERASKTENIEAILRWLWHQAERVAGAARQLTPQVDDAGWGAVSRATRADVWAQKYPFWPLSISPQTRFILRVARHLHGLRELHLGCAPVFGFPLVGGLWIWGLNQAVGEPHYALRWMERTPALAWTDLILLFLVWPIHAGGQIWQGPHAMESVRENWQSALAFYGATLAFLLGTLLVRLPSPF